MLPISDKNKPGYRIPGQVPYNAKDAYKPPKPISVEQSLELPINSVFDIVRGIIDSTKIEEWINFINNLIVTVPNGLALRKEIAIFGRELDPMARNIILMRTMKYYNQINKSFIRFNIDLEKAVPRGGNYFRRVPKKSGKGYNYYYTEDDYNRSKSSHLSGENAHVSYLGNKVKNILVNKNGSDASVFKNLIQKYGIDKVENILKTSVEKGDIKIKGNKFYWSSGSGKDDKVKEQTK